MQTLMFLPTMGPVEVTVAELRILADAAADPVQCVSDMTHKTRLRTVRVLARNGLLLLLQGAEAGWDADMWAAPLTCPGWNALWRAHGDRHVDGCGGLFTAAGFCDGCGALRRLDAAAFDAYLVEADNEERAFLTNRAQLWCDEHGFARQEQWTTDKTCRLPGSPYHEAGFIRC
jgi:hypothetical protein